MTALALALALSGQVPQSPAPPQWVPPWYGMAGRVYTSDTLHVGVRPGLYVDNENNGALEMGVGMTVQVTAYVP